MTNKIIVGCLLSISLFSGSAWSKNFYRAKTKLLLTYSTAYSKTVKIAKTKAVITFSDDNEENFYGSSSYCQLKIKSTNYNCTANYYGVNNFSIYLQQADLKEILKREMSIDEVRINKMKIAERMGFRREKDTNNILAKKRLTMQIHTDEPTESYHLISTAYKARRL
jgi:hypothetical protein